MRRMLALLASVVGVLVLACCDAAVPESPPPEPAASARAESPFGSLDVSVPATEMRTVDALVVSIALTRAPGVTAGELAFDPESAGWTVANAGAPLTERTADGWLETRWEFELQPFLDGDYAIPPASIELHTVDGGTAVLATPAQAVTVTSVLDGEAELAPARPIVVPDAARDDRPYWFAGGVAAVVISVVVAVVATRRRNRREAVGEMVQVPAEPRGRARAMLGSLAERISSLAGGSMVAATADELVPLVARCPWIGDRDAVVRLLADLESAIYGPTRPTEDDLAELERRTTRTLGALDPSTPGEEVA